MRYGTAYIFGVFILSSCTFNTAAQNLVPDPGFEIVRKMPTKKYNPVDCTKDWISVIGGSDYYNRETTGNPGVPKNIFGKQEPHSGDAYAGICIGKKQIEYIQTKLISTLIKGEDYLVELHISRSERSIRSVKEFGVQFSNKVIHYYDDKAISKGMSYKPNIDFTNSKGYKNKKEWTKLSAIYTAKGDENVIVLGYFNYDHPEGRKRFCHYYIDDVSITLIKKKNDTIVSTIIKDSIIKPFAPKLGETITLKNIFFTTNKSELLPQSFLELDILVQYLNNSPNTSIKISGHTDNTGNEDLNKTLSEARAKAVAGYLILKGIDKSRISYIGCGSSRPIATNDTDEGRQQNRRVEFIIN